MLTWFRSKSTPKNGAVPRLPAAARPPNTHDWIQRRNPFVRRYRRFATGRAWQVARQVRQLYPHIAVFCGVSVVAGVPIPEDDFESHWYVTYLDYTGFVW